MAFIEHVELELVENAGNGAVRVTYTLHGSEEDVREGRVYKEVVKLIGVDEGPGEDGQNNALTGGLIFNGTIVFGNGMPVFQSRLFGLSSSVFDEDSSTSQAPNTPVEDEIRAQVSLDAGPIIANSNLVKRGGPPTIGASPA